MFEALLITLREGVEAALVLAIALSVLRRRGQLGRRWALFAGAAVALFASIAVAALVSRITYDQELAEGVAMLSGSVLVFLLTWWMWRAAPHMKQEVESGLDRVAGARGSLGLFLFAFVMVLREGAETAIFLSAAGFNSAGVGRWIGALIGLALAALFGVMFVRGTIRVPLKPFFSITTAVLVLIGLQLLVGGLHELSEAQVLPASRTEMAIVGPVVKNELLVFALTAALVVGWLLKGDGAAAPAGGEGPQARLERARSTSERTRRRLTAVVGVIVVGILVAGFLATSRVPGKPPALAAERDSSGVVLETAPLLDDHAHFFETELNGRPTRFFTMEVNGELQVCLDACEICGDIGYFEDGSMLVCRNCTSPIPPGSLSRGGGCNPVPVRSRRDGERLRIEVSDLIESLGRVRER